MRAAELCAGYGGLALAVEQVFGAETAWVSEFEEAPSRILAHHWPEVPNHGDMTEIDWAAVEPVDIISGGTPCQDLSAAGRRKGMTEGTRSNLWVQMRESIATIKPTYVVWENVRGAYSAEAASDLEHCPGCMGASADRGTVLRALGRVLGDLSDLGYDCQWRGLRAADVGAPHGRFRVFILATHRGRIGVNGAGQRAEQNRRRQLADRRLTIADTHCGECDGRECQPFGCSKRGATPAGGGEVTGGFPWGGFTEETPADHEGTARRDTESDDQSKGLAGATEPRERTGSSADPSRFCGERWGGYGDVAGPSGAGEGQGHQREWNGDATDDCGAADPGVAWGEYEPAIRRWEAVMGRRAPAPTEPTGRNGGHRLSARFAEWMMGVPDGWIVDVPGMTRNEALKAAGNGVVPQQAIAALRDMLTERMVA